MTRIGVLTSGGDAPAVEVLADEETGVRARCIRGDVVGTPQADAVGRKKPLDPSLLALARGMAA